MPRKTLNSLIKGSIGYLAANLINASVPFLLLPVMTRYLDPSDYGVVAMYQTLVSGLGVLIGINVSGAAIRQHYDKQYSSIDKANFLRACLQIILISYVIVSIVVYCIRGLLANFLALETGWILWAAFTSATFMIIQLVLGQWQVQRKVRSYFLLQLMQSLFSLAVSVVFVVLLLEKAPGRIHAQILSGAVFALISLWLLRESIGLKIFRVDRASLKSVLEYGVPLIPHTAGIFALGFMDRIVINRMLGVDEVGVYIVALQISATFALAFDALNKSYVPWLFESLKRDSLNENKKIVRVIYTWFGIVILGMLVGILFGSDIMSEIVGPSFRSAASIISWFILGQGFWGMYLAVTNLVFYAKKTGKLSVATIISGLINLILLVYLTPLYGITGAAISFSASMCIRFLLTWYVAHKCHPMPWFNIGKGS